ncbi:MFS transporter [Microbacterium sp. 18062]|uniref:MFS transporter n=1 Tax=Microbacterium sp. 18062 TaxID=2681410 RepID=UPI00135BE7E3|nr:MFS transporter [Microbacterium sp. 18062]
MPLVAAVCLIAANMRATITGVGPLLDQIAADLGTSTAALGALASVPLLTWAIVSPLTHGLSTRFGMSRVVLWAMIALGAGTAWRSWPGVSVDLWLGTVLIGAALAVANVLMPAVIKRDFGRHVPLMMGLYTALLGGVGAIASGVVVPISQAAGGGADGWRIALAATSALLPIAIALWIWVLARGRNRASASGPSRSIGAMPATADAVTAAASGTSPAAGTGAASPGGAASAPVCTRAGLPPRRRGTGIWGDPVAWLVAAYMGMQSSSFYMLVTWLAPYATAHGRSAVVAGVDVMLFQILGVIGSFAVPLALRGRARRWVPALLPVAGLGAAGGLLLAPEALTIWALVAGLGAGASLSMSLTLMAERARDHATSSALSGMSQSLGYLFAALGPISFGALHAIDGGWTWPIVLLIAVLAAQAAVGVAVGRDRFVLDPR